jgi:hypothetical protein
MPKMTRLPTKQEFKQGLGLNWGVFGNQKSPFPALTRIGRLIEEYESKFRGREAWWATRSEEESMTKLFIHFTIERALRFVLHNRFDKEKLGGELSERQATYLRNLHEYVRETVKTALGATDDNYEQQILKDFGKEVCDSGKEEDQGMLERDALHYFRDALEQKRCKLSFRMGKAYKWNFTADDQGARKEGLVPYDTHSFNDDNFSEYYASLYVMNAKGNIFVQGWEGEKNLKHSSLLAGASVLCAGTIRINQGQVIWLTGKSGHYRPTVHNIVSLLERLSQYQVDLTNVKVFRENFQPGRQPVDISQWRGRMGLGPQYAPGQKNFEPCDATILLRDRAWPGPAQYAQTMRVG